MARYYVVWKGRRPGVYETWESCEEQVKGYKGAEYKSYKTLEEAAEAYKSGPGATFIREELGQGLTQVQVEYLKAREKEVEQEREKEEARACERPIQSKRPSRPLVPDDPENYPEDVKETLRRVLGR